QGTLRRRPLGPAPCRQEKKSVVVPGECILDRLRERVVAQQREQEQASACLHCRLAATHRWSNERSANVATRGQLQRINIAETKATSHARCGAHASVGADTEASKSRILGDSD